MRSLARENHSIEVFGSAAAACAKAGACADRFSAKPAKAMQSILRQFIAFTQHTG
jgi:hypothetical protein